MKPIGAPAGGLLALLLLPALASPEPADSLGGTGGGPITGAVDVRVIRAGTAEPIPGAFVMVGPRTNEPFEGNWGFASQGGAIRFEHPSLQGATTVTAGASGFAYATIVFVDANEIVLPLRPASAAQEPFQVGDYVSGIDVNNGSFHAGDGNIDMALVIPALRIESLLSPSMSGIMGPPEIVEILDTPFEIPSNIFIPQQWEIFVEIRKDHYYQYLPAGDYTLTAVSGRVPLDAVMNMGGIADLIPLMSWREIDILDLAVTGNTLDADLTVDPDLAPTATLNLANVPDGTDAWCYSLADIDSLAGLGRLVPMGINVLGCPAGTGPCSGTVPLTTTAPLGEFSGISYMPAVVIDDSASEDFLLLFDRNPHAQFYTQEMASFFRRLDLDYRLGTFSWSDATNPQSGSPPVDLHIARFVDPANGELCWEFWLPSGVFDLGAPRLPAEAPPAPIWGSTYRWQHVSLALSFGLPGFDFDAFAFSDILAHTSHAASDQMDFIYLGDPSQADEAPPAGLARLSVRPNPFDDRARICFDAPSGIASITVHSVDGRLVRTLLDSAAPVGGKMEALWDGKDSAGRNVAPGHYFVRLSTPEGTLRWKLVRWD